MSSEAKRKAEAAPDREKLLAYGTQIAKMQGPWLESEPARLIENEIKRQLVSLGAWIRGKAGEL